MAELHEATITPRKDELVSPWLRTRAWWDGVDDRGSVGTFRLDDPAGEVGIECFLFGSDTGSTLFVPVTYRGAELAGGDAHLIGTMQHSVLGDRWVYDACADPVFASVMVELIRTRGSEAEQVLHRADGSVIVREPTATVLGDGATDLPFVGPDDSLDVSDEATRTLVTTGDLTLAVARQVGRSLPDGPGVTASFAGGDGLRLATVGAAR